VANTLDADVDVGRVAVEVVHARGAGMDISKTDAKVCVRIAGAGRRKTAETVTTWGAMTGQILTLRDHLAAGQVTCVVVEATGDYWKPFYRHSAASWFRSRP
jgi:transposase